MDKSITYIVKKVGLILLSASVIMYGIEMTSRNNSFIGMMIVVCSILVFFWTIFLYFPQEHEK